MHQINVSKGQEVISEHELLLETVAHRDLETGIEIKLPTAIVEILKDKKASFKEWEDAISLYQVGGPVCLMTYLEGLDSIRKHFGSNPQIELQEYIQKTVTTIVKVVEPE